MVSESHCYSHLLKKNKITCMTFLEDFNNTHKFWVMDRLQYSQFYMWSNFYTNTCDTIPEINRPDSLPTI